MIAHGTAPLSDAELAFFEAALEAEARAALSRWAALTDAPRPTHAWSRRTRLIAIDGGKAAKDTNHA